MNNLKRLIFTLDKFPMYNFPQAGPILRKYNGTDWKLYEKFDPKRYNRAEVYKNNKFEIYVITWAPGQESSIHDHPDYGCWIKILRGNLYETIYNIGGKQTENKILNTGNVGFMHNDYGYHKITNKSSDISTSLHIYSPTDMSVEEIMEDCNKKMFG